MSGQKLQVEMSPADWRKAGEERYGIDIYDWCFVCPSCRSVFSVRQYKEAGAPEGSVGYSCLGRYAGAGRDAFEQGEGLCNYAGGGLVCINPLTVVFEDGSRCDVFDFADNPLVDAVEVG